MPDYKPFRTTRHIANLRQGRNDWYRIKNTAAPGVPSQLHIYDEIGFFGVTASDLVADLAEVKGDLEVHLNTPGGDLFEGIAIYNALKQRDDIVSIVIDSLAASAGSVIAMAADPGHLIISKNASMMIHDGFSMGIGNANDLRQLADLLDKQSDNIAGIYADRSGQPASQWREAMLAETWYVGQEAVDAGLADFVQGSEGANAAGGAYELAATWDLSIFAKAPRPQAAAEVPTDTTAAEDHGHGGQPCWDPDGDGDCDLTAAGDTDHDYWAEDGTQLKPVPGKPMPQDAAGHLVYAQGDGPTALWAAASVDEGAWDGPAAMSAASNADDPAAALSAICAGKRDGDPSTQAAHALPHHAHPGAPPNAHGVSAALGRIDGTQGLTNKQAAEAHLKAHQSAIGGGDSPTNQASTRAGLTPEAIANVMAALKELQ